MKRIRTAILCLAALLVVSTANAQNDWIRTGTGLGQEKVRLGVADFKSSGAMTLLRKPNRKTPGSELSSAVVGEDRRHARTLASFPFARGGCPATVGKPPSCEPIHGFSTEAAPSTARP